MKGEKNIIFLTFLNLSHMMDLCNENNVEIPLTVTGNTNQVNGKAVALK